jgi:DNA-binding transcriptional ArsR family regulator
VTAVAPFTTAPRARRSHTIDAERARFYALQWGEAEGFAYVAAGLPAADILARGWPLAEDETPSNPGELGDKMVMLLWSRATGDAFKAAGRPHTGKVFAWPAEAQALDRYIEKLAGEYDNVFVRKYLGATEADAKRGNPPTLAQVVQVEDAPADLEGLAPPYSYTVQTSEQKRQGYYRFARPLPWHTAHALAEAAGLRLQPLGADSGGPNPAQFCRVPTTRNTKERAERFRVRLIEGAGDVLPAELARAVGLNLAKPQLSAAKAGRDPGDLAGDAAAEPWRARSTRDALDALAAPWRPMVRQGRGGLLGDNGAPRGFKGRALENWSGDGTGDGSRDAYHLYTSLLYYGYTDGQALALAEHWAHEHRAGYATKRGAAGVWLDLCRVHFKACARLGDKRRIREAQPPADVTPIPGPELPRARRGRKPGAKVDNAEKLADELARRIGELVTRGDLAAACGFTPRTVTTHLRTLASAGRLDLLPGPRGFTVVRVEIKSCAAPIAAPAHQGALEAAEGGNKSAGAEGGNYGPAEALQCGGASLGEHAPQIATPRPAPAAGDAPALDLEALARELVENYGDAWDRAKKAAWRSYRIGGRGDGERVAALRAAYDELVAELRAQRKAATAARRRREAPERRRKDDARLQARAEAMSPTRRRAKLRNLERAIVADLRLASDLARNPRDAEGNPRTPPPRHRRRKDGTIAIIPSAPLTPRKLEARAWQWARQYAIVAAVHEARQLADFDAAAEEEWLLNQARDALDRAQAKAAGDAPRRPRVELGAKSTRESTDAPPAPAPMPSATAPALANSTPLDPGPPVEGGPLWLDAGKMAAARVSLVAKAARGESLIFAEVKGVKSGD